MEVENKKYTLQDYIKINWEISRLWVAVRAMDKVIRGSLPSLQILATAFRRFRFWLRHPS